MSIDRRGARYRLITYLPKRGAGCDGTDKSRQK
jgi:hypothetical protein